ncbi:MAG: RHS repeat protein [Lachnospiraceae bacterium]|nr:RHS repeat protein [Lachnospiraceae bacterium]
MGTKVEGTCQNGAIWLGDTEPENISGENSVSSNTVSGNAISENSVTQNNDVLEDNSGDNQDNVGNQVSFTYDAEGNLISVTSKGGTTNYYAYDAEHRLIEGKDTAGEVFVQNTYDKKGRVLTQDDGNAHTKIVETD